MPNSKKHAVQEPSGYLAWVFKNLAIVPLALAITATFVESAAAVEDTTPPTFTIAPADESTGIAVDSNITITASEPIRLQDGAALNDTNVDTVIVLKDFSLADIPFDATISGNVITINPTTDFSFNQWVYVAINVPDGPNFTNPAVDLEGNFGSASASFTTIAPPADTTAPTLVSQTPALFASGVAIDSNIVLTFSEPIQAGTGNIVITDGAARTRTIPVGNSQISISGTTLTINPTDELSSSTFYYVLIDASAVEDLAGNSYEGIQDPTTLAFTTAASANTPPVAEAGSNTLVASGATVTLDGTGSSDADGNPLAFSWTQTFGTSVTLSDATAAQPTFTAPTLAVGTPNDTLVFSLTVNDGTVNSTTDTVIITVQAPSTAPADTTAPTLVSQTPAAGATGVAVDSSIVLTFSENIQAGQTDRNIYISGSGDNRIIPVNDPQISISGATLTINPTDDLNSSTFYNVFIDPFFVADLSDNPFSGTMIGFITTTAPPADTTAPTFNIAPADGDTGVAVDSNITITVSEPIFASAAGQTFGGLTLGQAIENSNVDSVIRLSSGVDPIPFDATIAGNVITITPNSNFSFNQQVLVEMIGDHVQDTVGNEGDYAKAVFTTIASPNSAPTADAGPDQTGIASGASVTLDGTGSSDPDVGDVLNYVWTQTAGTTVSLSSATASQPSFTAPTLGANDAAVTLTFSLVVTDDKSNSSTADTVDITISPPANSAPTADAGPDQTGVASGASVALDGTGSSDPDVGDVLSYAWTQTAGTTVSLSSATASQPSFTAPTLGANDAAVTLTFSLVVTDDKSNSSTADTVDITVNPPAPTPASEFERYEAEICEVVMDDAERSLQSTVAANRRMTNDARERFIASRQATDEDVGLVSRNNVPFDVNGTFAVNNTTLSTSGSFFEQTGNYEGTQRRLFFGDFDVQHYGDTGSTTATLTARVAWEQMTSDRTMLGYFIGGELAHSNIDGAFEGDQDRIGVTIGGYAVHQLADQVYLDGFLTLGAGRNNLDMANDVLALTSDYTTRTATMGAAVSGVYDYGQYEFRPELAFSYGQTWIGDVGFTGRAYGLVDDTLSLDGGNVSIANLTLRPEIVWALDADTVADSNSQLSFAPRVICERTIAITRTENCGGGAEIGLRSTSEDGLSNAEFRVIMDRVGNSTRSSLAFNLERRF